MAEPSPPQPPIVPDPPSTAAPFDPANRPVRKTRRPWLVIGGLVALLLVGVVAAITINGSRTDTPAASKAPSAWDREQQLRDDSKPGTLEYATAVQLVAALNKAGTACADWKWIPDAVGAQERGSCHVSGEEVTTAIFTSGTAAQAEPQKKAELLAGISDVHMVVGPNWTLGCDSAELCKGIADSFGGTLVTVPSASATTTPEPTATTPPPARVSYAKLTERQWKKVAKDPDTYVGKGYIVYGVVTQFDSATGTDTFRADVAARNLAESYDYDTNTLLSGDEDDLTDLVEDDEFRAKVLVVGSYSYETQIGGETTVPQLQVVSIEVL